ncbi:unnamed protein product [Nippostrongylus brasiliensis]|uniref:acetate--CoA ligase n=1 Tax=Nippostrongylus brasiliensis TaxID=27835 RepID=A0A0N4YSN9_NIPBR|nr:unnamed protein product [Nippostrongylus brasiliensis]
MPDEPEPNDCPAGVYSDEVYPPPASISAKAHVPSMQIYQEMYNASINDSDAFWKSVAEELYFAQGSSKGLEWNFDPRKGDVFCRFMDGAKTNISYNCLERNLERGLGDKVAYFWEGNEPTDSFKITYAELHAQVVNFSAVLRAHGVKKGDAVAIYLPMIMELAVAMLACARIGAMHSVVFAGFSAEALGARITDAKGRVLITADGFYRGTKYINLKQITDEAVRIAAEGGVDIRSVIVVSHQKRVTVPKTSERPSESSMSSIDFDYTSEMAKYKHVHSPVEWVDAESPVLLLYTSHSLSSLEILAVAGESTNPEAWKWLYEVVGDHRCAIVDNYWETETAGPMLTPLPGATPTKPGSATYPFFGVSPVLLDAEGKVIEGPGEGNLCYDRAWPSMLRTIYRDHDRFVQTYFAPFNGYFFTGDGARRDADGYLWITGRIDDLMNVSGHLLSTVEIESALMAHPKIAEARVVAAKHDVKGAIPYAFVILNNGEQLTVELKLELEDIVRKKIGPIAVPEAIQPASELPKTRSGKVARRILRKIADGSVTDMGDTTTLVDEEVIKHLIDGRIQV